VKEAQNHNLYGGVVIIESPSNVGPVTVILAHLRYLSAGDLLVSHGDSVRLGQPVGRIAPTGENGGDYGPHLHIGIHKGAYSSVNEICNGKKQWSYAGRTFCPDVFLDDWYDSSDFIAARIPPPPPPPPPPPVDPVARPDSYEVSSGQSLTISAPGVLANDTVPSNFESVTFIAPPSGFVDLGKGGFIYTPEVGVTGAVTFAYSIHTQTVDSPSATVTIHVSPTAVDSLDDDFGGSSLSTSRWSLQSATLGATAQIASSRLELAVPPGAGGAGVISKCFLDGDFDVQIDYELLNWPVGNLHQLGFRPFDLYDEGAGASGVWRQSAVSSENYVGVYPFYFGSTAVATTDQFGSLRLVRSGATLTGFHRAGGSWTAVRSAPVSSVPTRVALELASLQVGAAVTQEASIAFDNFIVNGGTCAAAYERVIEPVGSPVSTGLLRPGPLAVSPSGKLLFVGVGTSVGVYNIDSSGALTAVTGSPFSTGGQVQIAVDPLGRFLFATSGSTVKVFSIGASGTLTSVPGSPFASGGVFARSVVVAPDGNRLFVSHYGSSLDDPRAISVFDIDSSGGLLPIPGSPFSTGLPRAVGLRLAIHPTRSFLFVTGDYVDNTGSARNAIGAFTFGATGALAPIAGSPFSSGALRGGSENVAVSPDGRFLHVLNTADDSVSTLSIDAIGALTNVAGSPVFVFGTDIRSSMAISPDGRFIFTPDNFSVRGVNSDAIAINRVGPSGSLTPVTASPIASEGWGVGFDGLAVSPHGQWLFISHETTRTVGAFKIAGGTVPETVITFDSFTPEPGIGVGASGFLFRGTTEVQIGLLAVLGSPGAQVEMSSKDGSSFTLTQFDTMWEVGTGGSTTMLVTGTLAEGGTVSTSISVDSVFAGLRTFVLPAGFTDLSRVVFSANDRQPYADFYLDNILVR
jgi:6-phosphogluconolactonase (cycloisomerase 2 family)